MLGRSGVGTDESMCCSGCLAAGGARDACREHVAPAVAMSFRCHEGFVRVSRHGSASPLARRRSLVTRCAFPIHPRLRPPSSRHPHAAPTTAAPPRTSGLIILLVLPLPLSLPHIVLGVGLAVDPAQHLGDCRALRRKLRLLQLHQAQREELPRARAVDVVATALILRRSSSGGSSSSSGRGGGRRR